MISGDAYIRKLRRMTGQKKERVNTRTYSFKKAKMSNTKKNAAKEGIKSTLKRMGKKL